MCWPLIVEIFGNSAGHKTVESKTNFIFIMAFQMACASNCGSVELLAAATTCELKERVTAPSRAMFIPCDITLPDPIKGSIKPLFDDGSIVLSPPLGGWEFSEPEYANTNISTCIPAYRTIVSRTIKFTDRIAITSNTGSPATINKFADLPFYEDKLAKRGLYYVALVHCNGDAYLPRTSDGVLITASLDGYIDYEVKDEASNYIVQVKRFTVKYQGDPFAFHAPDFNLIEESIVF